MYQDDYTDDSYVSLYGSGDEEDFESEFEEFAFPEDDKNSNIDDF